MTRKQYKHLLFDLDGTLWDFRKSSLDSLKSLFIDARLQEKGVPDFESFHRVFKQINEDLWAYYRRGEMSREVLSARRFQMALAHFDIDEPALPLWFGDQYLARSTRKDYTYPDAKEVLAILRGRAYRMHILTNGFYQVQQEKLHRSGLRPFFEIVLSSEEIGIGKPEAAFFEKALARIGAGKQESLMIGDDKESDIGGAREAGIDQVWFNPDSSAAMPCGATYHIHSLMDLVDLLP